MFEGSVQFPKGTATDCRSYSVTDVNPAGRPCLSIANFEISSVAWRLRLSVTEKYPMVVSTLR